MQVIRDADPAPSPAAGAVVTIGAYDGVHLGHQALIADVRRRAQASGWASVVVTFDRHPASVVRPDSAPRLLTDLDQKLELLAATGVDYTLVVHFDRQRATESAEDFVTEVLVGRLGARCVVVGHDFHFGHRRRGNVALLEAMGAQYGFEVVGTELVSDDGVHEVVSSTRIRHLLGQGRPEEAAALLGRLHEVRGVVERGDGRAGALLGYPTANVAVPGDILLPADGIYAGWYERGDGTSRPAAISVGLRPTFYPDGGARLLEAHILDFSGDLYGETAGVRFASRIRDEEKFDSVEQLVARMDADVARCREILGAVSPPGPPGAAS
ncbi:MAG TPA: bifunctional riboflavin kinase/FAD synthetase [Acidimicrobiales bacterium]|nr:bifunctional riboflavin kinase/FAD synthetase [Acidimicrobiales bacterium]